MSKGWIGVDLDATLAHYDKFISSVHIGAPIPAMVDRVKRWLAEGHDVRIFTARVSTDGTDESAVSSFAARNAIAAWCLEHIGQILPITNIKDWAMWELWDDRCVTVEPNTGRMLAESSRGLE